MTRMYRLGTPEKMNDLKEYVTENPAAFDRYRKVWAVGRRNGASSWDGKILLRFRTDGHLKFAEIVKNEDGGATMIARVKYIWALNYARDNLEEVTA